MTSALAVAACRGQQRGDGRARRALRRGLRDRPAGWRGPRGGLRRNGGQHPGADRLRRPGRGHRAHAPRPRSSSPATARCSSRERRGTVQDARRRYGAISQVLDISADVNAPVFVDQGLLGFALDPGFVGDGGVERLSGTSRTRSCRGRVLRGQSRVSSGSSGTGPRSTPPRGRCSSELTPGRAARATPVRPPRPRTACPRTRTRTPRAGSPSAATAGSGSPCRTAPRRRAVTRRKDPLALRAQNDNSLAGKLLRVDRATGNGVAGQPGLHSGEPESPASRTWVKGFRNPFRLAQRPDGTQGLLHHRRGLGRLGGAERRARAFRLRPAARTTAGRAARARSERLHDRQRPCSPAACPDPLPDNHDPLVRLRQLRRGPRDHRQRVLHAAARGPRRGRRPRAARRSSTRTTRAARSRGCRRTRATR